MSKVTRDQAGFTLIELVVVVAILAIIAFLVTPRVLDALDKSKRNSAISVMNEIAGALERYAAKQGEAAGTVSYPDGAALCTAGPGSACYTALAGALSTEASLPEFESTDRYWVIDDFEYSNIDPKLDYAVQVTARDRGATVICAKPTGVTLDPC